MKGKPIDENNESLKKTRYNDNTIGFASIEKNGKSNIEKYNYSSLVLMSIMNELGNLKNELIKDSFDEAKSFVEEYEGE